MSCIAAAFWSCNLGPKLFSYLLLNGNGIILIERIENFHFDFAIVNHSHFPYTKGIDQNCLFLQKAKNTEIFSSFKRKREMIENPWSCLWFWQIACHITVRFVTWINQINFLFVFDTNLTGIYSRVLFPLSSTCQVLLSIVIDKLVHHKSQLNPSHPSRIPYFYRTISFPSQTFCWMSCLASIWTESKKTKAIEKLIFKLVNFRSYYFRFANIS